MQKMKMMLTMIDLVRFFKAVKVLGVVKDKSNLQEDFPGYKLLHREGSTKSQESGFAFLAKISHACAMPRELRAGRNENWFPSPGCFSHR